MINKKGTENIEQSGYRYELKFLCTQLQINLLEAQLDCLMERDGHSGPAGFYTVRSLYFDDYDNNAMKQKEDGVDERKKYRIRSYLLGMDDSFRLEIKHSVQNKIRKESCTLTAQETQQILEGRPVEQAYNSERKVLRKFELARDIRFLRPVVIVEYDRMPYIYANGNVRITIDRNIRFSPDTTKFMERNIMEMPVLGKGIHLLEIKYDEYLPDFIRQALQIVSLNKTSFSKYYLCRLAGEALRMSGKE